LSLDNKRPFTHLLIICK